jgi:hypothetical protein
MKISFQAPLSMEMEGLKATEDGCEWTVRVPTRQVLAGAGYITITGDGGMQRRYLVRVSVHNGALEISDLDKLASVRHNFDLPPAEYNRRREQRRERAKAMQEAKSRSLAEEQDS